MNRDRSASPRFHIKTLGCKVNKVESDTLQARLLASGALESDPERADLIVINSCTVTGEADSKVRKAIRQALASSPDATVLVTGCAASIDPDSLSAISPQVQVEADKSQLFLAAAALLDLDAHASMSAEACIGGSGRSRVQVKIQDGCDNYCAYCIIAHARGPLRSEPLSEIVRTVERVSMAGTCEIVLTGINLGRYFDPESGADLPGLIRSLADTGIKRIRLSSIEPPDLTDELLDALKNSGVFARHLHVPLQSGSNSVLDRMGRKYTAEQYVARVKAARERFPGIAITTDVIAGFPGETEVEALETMDLCSRMEFAKIHVFRYSSRAGTPAATMDGQIPSGVKASRALRLRQLSNDLRAAYIEQTLSSTPLTVVVESIEEHGDTVVAKGTSDEYLSVTFADKGRCGVGELVMVSEVLSAH